MARIKAILEEEDLGGFVVIHTPGYSEFVTKINPSYSCATIMPNGVGIRVNSTGIKDPEEKKQKVTDTANLIIHLADVVGQNAMNLIKVAQTLEQKLDIDKSGPGFSSHSSQNN